MRTSRLGRVVRPDGEPASDNTKGIGGGGYRSRISRGGPTMQTRQTGEDK
ncbi:MAG TPA: hypothetical protein P5159_26465 [Phycisphaerae bacterium]|nr:hypothetical protein [Phycisphaerae bacterium]